MPELSPAEKKLLEAFKNLNEYGKKNLLEYGDYLTQLPKYRPGIIPFQLAKKNTD